MNIYWYVRMASFREYIVFVAFWKKKTKKKKRKKDSGNNRNFFFGISYFFSSNRCPWITATECDKTLEFDLVSSLQTYFFCNDFWELHRCARVCMGASKCVPVRALMSFDANIRYFTLERSWVTFTYTFLHIFSHFQFRYVSFWICSKKSRYLFLIRYYFYSVVLLLSRTLIRENERNIFSYSFLFNTIEHNGTQEFIEIGIRLISYSHIFRSFFLYFSLGTFSILC